MAINNYNTMFYLLNQEGLFRTSQKTPDSRIFVGKQGRVWVKKLFDMRLETRYRTVRNQVSEFLDVSTYMDLEALIKNEKPRLRASKRAFAMLGHMFGIDGTEQEIISKVENYASIADNVIRYLKSRVFAHYEPYFEMTNEIEMTSNPVELLLIIFDDRYHKKARFEAKRKLVLMNMAASIDQRERETDVEKNFKEFLKFLNEYVWNRDDRIGESNSVFLVSRHDVNDFTCLEVKVIPQQQFNKEEHLPGYKITPLNRRRFQLNGRGIPIYVSVRKKSPEAKVLKLLRKGEENPAVAVDDELGLMGVVDSPIDIKLFQQHLTHSATRAGSFMALEEVDDNLSSVSHKSNDTASQPRTAMFKFFARMGGMRVELILHSNKTYLDYIYRRCKSHDEYEVKRIIDSGVGKLLFPQDIYNLDLTDIRDELIQWIRRRIEET
jgi:hypothetical protein